jgi:hypothetical protein
MAELVDHRAAIEGILKLNLALRPFWGHRLKQLTGLVLLLGAAALIGCATQVSTTSQWGASQGFERVDLQGQEYFCRVKPTNEPSNLSNVSCLTPLELLNLRIASERTTSADAPFVAFTHHDGP